jgi:hypothetical protein
MLKWHSFKSAWRLNIPMPICAKDHSVVRIERYVDSLVAHDVQTALLALLAASGVLWLIAVENATNLLLAQYSAPKGDCDARCARR